VVTAGTKVEDFHIVAINRKHTRRLGQVPIKIWQVFFQFNLTVSQALEFLKCDRLVPNQRYFFSMLAAGNLREITKLGWPLRMVA